MTLGKFLRMGLFGRGANQYWRAGIFSTPTPTLTQKARVGEHMEGAGRPLHPERAWKPCALPIPCPMHLFYVAVPELYTFIINW